MFVGVVIQV